MVQLQTVDPNKQDRSIILPIVGEVKIPVSGIIEVANKEIAALLVEAEVGFELFEGSFSEAPQDVNVANVIKENVKLKEQNAKLSLENDSLKKDNAALLVNQKPISVVVDEPIVVSDPVVVTDPVVEKVKLTAAQKTAAADTTKPADIDIAAKIAAVTTK